MKLETFKCDACGKVKGEANKWYRAAHVVDAFVVQPFEARGHRSKFADDPSIDVMDLCGEGCVLKKLQEFMATAHPEPAESEAGR